MRPFAFFPLLTLPAASALAQEKSAKDQFAASIAALGTVEKRQAVADLTVDSQTQTVTAPQEKSDEGLMPGMLVPGTKKYVQERSGVGLVKRNGESYER